jgi:diaminopimelate epimerase
MSISFYKYQGTGNDFIMIDNRSMTFPQENLPLIQKLCDRKFGIGADGLILIQEKSGLDFEMVYFNADGSQSMCGNGARCAVAFARQLGIIDSITHFLAIDGEHKASISEQIVSLKMNDVDSIVSMDNDFFINTGSPHHIRYVQQILDYPVVEEGAKIRYSEAYSPKGTNVNFVSPLSTDQIFVRTYERGVEDETLSCGTGVTACAIHYGHIKGLSAVKITTLGGELEVKFESNGLGGFKEILLIGPALPVYQGYLDLKRFLI